jgi:hypothetical protein
MCLLMVPGLSFPPGMASPVASKLLRADFAALSAEEGLPIAGGGKLMEPHRADAGCRVFAGEK